MEVTPQYNNITNVPRNDLIETLKEKEVYKSKYLRYKKKSSEKEVEVEQLKQNNELLLSKIEEMQITFTKKEDQIRKLEEHTKSIIDQSCSNNNTEIKTLKDRLVEKDYIIDKLTREKNKLKQGFEDERKLMKDQIVKLQQELKENENNVKQVLDESSIAVESMKNRNKEEFQRQYQEFQKCLEKMEKENKDLKQEINQRNKDIKALKQEIGIKEKEMLSLQNDLDQTVKKLQKYKFQHDSELGRIDSKNEEIRVLNEKVEMLTQKIVWLKEENQRIAKQCDEEILIHVDKLEEQQNSFNKKIREYRQLLEDHEKEKNDHIELIEKSENEKRELIKQIENLEKNYFEEKNANQELTKQIEDLNESRSTEKNENQELTKQLEELNKARSTEKNEIITLKEIINVLEKENYVCMESLKELERKLEEKYEYYNKKAQEDEKVNDLKNSCSEDHRLDELTFDLSQQDYASLLESQRRERIEINNPTMLTEVLNNNFNSSIKLKNEEKKKEVKSSSDKGCMTEIIRKEENEKEEQEALVKKLQQEKDGLLKKNNDLLQEIKDFCDIKEDYEKKILTLQSLYEENCVKDNQRKEEEENLNLLKAHYESKIEEKEKEILLQREINQNKQTTIDDLYEEFEMLTKQQEERIKRIKLLKERDEKNNI